MIRRVLSAVWLAITAVLTVAAAFVKSLLLLAVVYLAAPFVVIAATLFFVLGWLWLIVEYLQAPFYRAKQRRAERKRKENQ